MEETASAADTIKKEPPDEHAVLARPKRHYRTTSNEDRRKIIQCARIGKDLVSVAKHLGINLKTCRAIAATDREVALKRGFAKRKFSDEYVKHLRSVLDENPYFTLMQLKTRMETDMPDITISISSIDRLLDGYCYSRKKLSTPPEDQGHLGAQEDQAEYAHWLESDGMSKLKIYISETNLNIWCSKSFGKSKVQMSCVRAHPSSRGANLDVVVGTSVSGIIEYECYPRFTTGQFVEFLEKCSRKIYLEQPGVEVVFTFANTPIHKRASEAKLREGHAFKCLSPCSQFFDPLEEIFRQFNTAIKTWLSENITLISSAPDGCTMKDHRYKVLRYLYDITLQNTSPLNNVDFDPHFLTFIDSALNPV
ncbi:hypothetical protein PHET_03379 [Paragonimus heterotremus]|uniref:Tc1-like transposase DDE domain-containing protein n=1 Tax=Paragonimus heterotremus TaxID=100268 RepID=A0A8J4SR49_9TREM|nr:hypothetical protein PHET_03379 [Paragonimus heterotremus]